MELTAMDNEELKRNSENTAKILDLLQGKLGDDGLVHKVGKIYDTIQIHKSELETAKTEREAIRQDVSKLKAAKIKFVTAVSTAGLLGTKGLEKLAAVFGGGNHQ